MKPLLLLIAFIPFLGIAQDTEYTSTYNKLYEDSTGKYIIYYDYNADSAITFIQKLSVDDKHNGYIFHYRNNDSIPIKHYPAIIQVVKYNANRQWFIGKFKGYLVKENCIEDDPKEWIKKALNKIK